MQDRKNTYSKTTENRGKIIAVQGITGGVGATNFTINLAWEISRQTDDDNSSVCVIDLDIQHGCISNYISERQPPPLHREETRLGYKLKDGEILGAEKITNQLTVLPSPKHLAPNDIISYATIQELINQAAQEYDFVIIDLASSYEYWWEEFALSVDILFLIMFRDIRGAINLQRLHTEILANPKIIEKCWLILTKSAKIWELAERRREKTTIQATSFRNIDHLPDAGGSIRAANDIGKPISKFHQKSCYVKSLKRLASRLRLELQSEKSFSRKEK